MKSLNLCQFIGNLGKDPETRFTPAGVAVCNFSIAVSDDYKDKQSGQMVEQTEWVRCVVFGKLAEVCGKYLHKGSKVYVSGKMVTRKFADKQTGADRYVTEITLENMQMLDGKGGGQQNQGAEYYEDAQPRGRAAASAMDDDIPF